MDDEPFSDMTARELWLLAFPKWFVKYVVAPFPRESGWIPVAAKWFIVLFSFEWICESLGVHISPWAFILAGTALAAFALSQREKR